MQATEWKQIKEILNQALELDLSERQKLLAKLDVDEKIIDEVKSLLAQEKESEEFMSITANNYSADILPNEFPKESPIIEQEIGIYKIIEELGIGGMGAVYLGVRTDGKFEQKVAIKLLKREYNTKKIREQFKREREIQAKLTHPNIATIIDAGTSEDSIPYLVMEYIEGVPIDKFCEQSKPSLNERLKLFNKVCEAISYAHQNLVVHRDLKPSNILVTKSGEPKLLDFGISKILSEDKEISKTTTNFAAMTPAYASPEQIKRENLTTATDIYSLGVILFKILTNSHPFNTENKTDLELLKEISDENPTIPSKAITFEDKNTSGKLSILPSQLKGDLDNIILKSLRKQPERRYRTVESFANDIWRYLDVLPVKARPNTFKYRAIKFFGRNKVSVLAGALTILGLSTGLTIAIWQANVAKKQAKIAEAESKRSKEEEERAKTITKFMEKIISYANPANYAEGSKTQGQAKVIDVLEEMSNKIETDFPNQKDVQAELHHKFAEVYVMVSHKNAKTPHHKRLVEKSTAHAKKALIIRKEFYGEKHELVAKDMYYLAVSGALSEIESIKLLAEAIAMMRETNRFNVNLPYMLTAYANRLHSIVSEEKQEIYFKEAKPNSNMTKLELAESYYIEALAIFKKHYPDKDFRISSKKCQISLVMAKQNKLEELKPFYQDCKKATKLNYKDGLQKGIETQIKNVEGIMKSK